MSSIKNIFDNSKNHSALLFEDNKIKIIKLKEKENNFFPIYWNSFDFDLNNLLNKSEMIELFKKIKNELDSEEINFDIISKNKEEIEKEIISNLKISGFQKIHPINWDYNINNLIIDKKSYGKNIFTFSPDNKNLELNYFEKGVIRKKELVKISEINSEKIKYFIKNTDNNHVFISGYFDNNLNYIENRFYELGIKVHVYNLWKNILSFDKNIPIIFKNESHKYIKVISLALPPQKKISYKKENKKIKKIESKKEIKNDIDIDFIIDNKKETKIISEKNTLWQEIKKIFNKIIFGPKNSESFKYLHEENHILNKKLFLPKPKLKLFLPKPHKILKNKKVKEKTIFLPKPSLIIKNKHSFKLVNIEAQNKKNKNKNLLPKEKKKLFLPKPKKDFWKKIKKFFNQPVLFQIKNKKK